MLRGIDRLDVEMLRVQCDHLRALLSVLVAERGGEVRISTKTITDSKYSLIKRYDLDKQEFVLIVDLCKQVMRDMRPTGLARPYFTGWRGRFKKFRLEFKDLPGGKDDWCEVYAGKRKVWACNGTFAREHFYQQS